MKHLKTYEENRPSIKDWVNLFNDIYDLDLIEYLGEVHTYHLKTY
jgi:hypothetical protein